MLHAFSVKCGRKSSWEFGNIDELKAFNKKTLNKVFSIKRLYIKTNTAMLEKCFLLFRF
jgi:hypothetical protein